MKKVTRLRATIGGSKVKTKIQSAGGEMRTTASGTKFKLKGQTS